MTIYLYNLTTKQINHIISYYENDIRAYTLDNLDKRLINIEKTYKSIFERISNYKRLIKKIDIENNEFKTLLKALDYSGLCFYVENKNEIIID